MSGRGFEKKAGVCVTETYEIGPVLLDAEAQALTQAGKSIGLGQRAVAVLAVPVRSVREFVPKARLMEAVWHGVVVEETNLAVQISAIRQVLAQAPGGEGWRRGLGY